MFQAAWSDFLVITVSNDFPNKLIILKRYRLSSINSNKIGLFFKNRNFYVNKNNFCM